MAAKIGQGGDRPPEVRVGKISSTGRVRLEFTNSMKFPSQEEFIELNRSSENGLIDLLMYKGDEDELDDNLESWEIVSV